MPPELLSRLRVDITRCVQVSAHSLQVNPVPTLRADEKLPPSLCRQTHVTRPYLTSASMRQVGRGLRPACAECRCWGGGRRSFCPATYLRRLLPGLEYEMLLNERVSALRIPFWTEGDMRQHGYFKTPDVWLQVGRIKGQTDKPTASNHGP